MKEFLIFITSNIAFDAAFLSWFIAQVIKMVTVLVTEKTFSIRRFMDSGGMPSSHSAFVAALAVCIAFIDGFASTQFALAAALACVVMYDAAGVRRAAGEQAKVLNKLMDAWEDQEPEFVQTQLKEIMGHTPAQVGAGALLGIVIGLIFMLARET
jgi:acid phosphatase family membrane protein YuiD